MKKVRFGIIGVGNQGSNYAVKKFGEGKITNGVLSAVCDINPIKIEAVKSQIPTLDVTYFDNYIEMLDSGLVDAVIVAVPHYDHPRMVMDCLQRGISVICEKPAGVYTKQVREMNEVAKKSHAHFGMMFNQRTNCVYRKMKDMIANGDIGELQRVNWIITNWYRTQEYYDSGSWRATWAGEGGGVLINQCPHQIDLVQWIVGELPVSVNGFCQYGRWHDIEVEDEVTAYFRYKNGATGVFITTTGEAPGTNRLEISGTRGKLLVENDKLTFYRNAADTQEWSKTATEGFKKPDVEIIEVETDGQNPQHTGIINNFANALLGLEEFFVDGTEGIRGVELMNAIELSGWRGGEAVAIPVNEEEYLGELNAHRAVSRLKVGNDNAVADTAGTFGGSK
ncbi:MAG: Gfo/Idh/MocA family oxidoreductase [Ruminococcaceae bacterium]|nr:Gfo/Idh/MocA family oxidoreductase [Oscillospiraceae bacterium]